MNVIKKFSKIFNILMDDHRNIIFLSELQDLYNLGLIEMELLLNIIKGVIFTLYADYNKIDIYIDILKLIKNNNSNKLFFKYFNKLNFSGQFDYEDHIINNLFNHIDIFIINHYNKINIFEMQYFIVKEINDLSINLDNKINLYIIILKYINKLKKINTINIKNQLIDIFESINIFFDDD